MKIYTCLLLLCATLLCNGQNNQAILENYFNTNSPQLGLTQEDVNDFRINSATYSKSMKLDNVYVSQRLSGIEVFNSTSVFAIKNGVVVSQKLGFVPNAVQKVNTQNPAITAQNAIVKAATALGIEAPAGLEILETKADNNFIFNTGGISLNNIPVSLVFRPTLEGKLHLAWDLSIYLLDASHYFSLRIDALTGTV